MCCFAKAAGAGDRGICQHVQLQRNAGKDIGHPFFLLFIIFLMRNWSVNAIKKKKKDVNFIFEWQAQQLLHHGRLGRRH